MLDQIGIETLHDVYLPDGRPGRRWTQIDHLVLTAAGVLVVETKNYGGKIYASQYDRTWTHWIGGQKHSFQNPLGQNRLHVEAVRSLVPGVRVLERVVFTDRATFGKEMPKGVSMLKDLRRDPHEELGIKPAAASDELLAAWETIKTRVDRSPTAKREHLEDLRERFGPSKSTEPEIRIDDVLDAVEAVQRRARGSTVAEPGIYPNEHPERFGPKAGPAFSWGRLVGPLVAFALFGGLALLLPKLLAPPPTRTHGSVTAFASAESAAGPAWIPLPPVVSRPIPAVASAKGRTPPRATPPAPIVLPGPPKYVVRAEPPSSPQEAATQACNTAIASILVDNSTENRVARDAACGRP